ncbi:MAG: DUF2905 domain-containing protein [Candidatus Omnitrophica bacterium]|nr:DUF2905 domain-containing protein [Candidatus Omnitrophota bacterium]
MNLEPLGKFLIGAGIVLVILGALFVSGKGFGPLGKLPGDIRVEKPNFSFYFPIVTCIAISAVLTLVMWILSSFR